MQNESILPPKHLSYNQVESLRFKRTLSGGAEIISDNLVRFSIWAPTATKVNVVLSAGIEHEMQKEDATGWYKVELNCSAGTHYSYRVFSNEKSSLRIPDPISRAQVDGVHGESIVVDPEQYHWHNSQWKGKPWHESVIYELHVGLCGGFNGVRSILGSLAATGFTAIELMPIATFPGNHNWGYDGVLMFAPQFSYGSPDELKALIDEAHTLGICVYLDVVYNHFGPDGNYLHAYAPEFFISNKHTPWGAGLNYEKPEVGGFFKENALYWLEEYQFDGLRLDACHSIWDKDWLKRLATSVKEEFPERHIHLIAENFDNESALLRNGFDAQWNDDGHHILHHILTKESDGYYSDYVNQPAKKLATFLAEGFIYQGQESEYHDNIPRGQKSSDLPPSSFILFLQNHDQIGNRPFGERLTTLVDEEPLRVASALLLLSPQIPMLFMGEEFGATEPFLYFTSHDDEALIAAIKEGRQKEFSKFCQFKDADTDNPLPDSNKPNTFFASIPVFFNTKLISKTNNLSWHEWTANLLDIRHEHIIPGLLGAKAISSLPLGDAAVISKWKLSNDSVLIIALNFSEDPVSLTGNEIEYDKSMVLFEYNKALDAIRNKKLGPYSFIAMSGHSS